LDLDWTDAASRLLKAEIAREGITLARLAERLNRLGLKETEASLKNKLYRGSFSLTFFMQCIHALGGDQVSIASVLPADMPKGRALESSGR